MSNTSNVRNDIKKLAQQIENLAHEVQTRVDQGSDIITVANELVRNSSTFVFTLGGMYALEENGKQVNATQVKMPSQSNKTHSYHNVRDSLGRFSKV